jgi:hypothetical protein
VNNTNRCCCCRSSSEAGQRTHVMRVPEEEEEKLLERLLADRGPPGDSSQLVAYSLFLRPTGRGKQLVVEEEEDGSHHRPLHSPVLLVVLVSKIW